MGPRISGKARLTKPGENNIPEMASEDEISKSNKKKSNSILLYQSAYCYLYIIYLMKKA